MADQHYPLKTIFHMHSETVANEEYRVRSTSSSTLTWNFHIGKWQLFATLTTSIVSTMEEIWQQEMKLERLWVSVPPLAQSHYLTGLLIEEILATNDIEGIRSTRQEITEALASGNSDRTKRFQEMAQLYKRLATRSGSRIEFPKSLSEVRSLYDDLLRDEISPEDKPDGTHFRAQTVSVVDGLKTIHTAPRDEASINTRMEAFLDSQLGKEHALVNALMGHFMFEYTHPFYDGNGRLGRFLLALRLSDVLSHPSALSLSHQFSFQRKRYYSAFQKTEEPLNRGEGTFFLEDMLEILHEAQLDILTSLLEKRSLLESVHRRLSNEKLSNYSHGILYSLAQVTLFGSEETLTLSEIVSVSPYSWNTLRKEAELLVKKQLLIPVSKRPLTYALAPAARKFLEPDQQD